MKLTRLIVFVGLTAACKCAAGCCLSCDTGMNVLGTAWHAVKGAFACIACG